MYLNSNLIDDIDPISYFYVVLQSFDLRDEVKHLVI